MNIFGEIVKLVLDYGFDVVCAAVVIYFAISSYLTNQKLKKLSVKDKEDLQTKVLEQNEKFMESIRKLNEAIMNKILQVLTFENTLANSVESDEVHLANLQIRMSISTKVNNIINGIREKNNADRALVLEFHNSNKNLSGMPFAKFSCSYEDMKYGNDSVSGKLENFPFSTISNIIKDLLDSENNYLIYADIDTDMKKSSVSYSLLKQFGIKSTVFVPLHDIRHNIIGLVAVSYNNADLLTTLDINDVLQDVKLIEELIDLRNPKV